ncbi:unnamed protein product [Vitrella brassicaformis CCMP3155]|uniref:Uncharacterized protein n=1 Tax=Vitrella brassicaformis (strain CCMP3155) TaxID=1169540 RepID=A0A0G4GSU3_VITBC|nr:unnamed protein product [Vitrella brassicaformis CCMP3155]|eukprot:CEM33763.1 unnamed protein product [Vitrella brassicaformis CCMP3155]
MLNRDAMSVAAEALCVALEALCVALEDELDDELASSRHRWRSGSGCAAPSKPAVTEQPRRSQATWSGGGEGSCQRRVFRLIRLLYVLDMDGDWAGSAELIRLASHYRRIEGPLPMQLTAADVQHAGRKARVDRRPASMRQYFPLGHRLGTGMTLTRGGRGRDKLGDGILVVHTRETVPDAYKDGFDDDDPVCGITHFNPYLHRGFLNLATNRMIQTTSRQTVHCVTSVEYLQCHSPAAYALLAQQGQLWGHRTIIDDRLNSRTVILCGDKPGDNFAAHIRIKIDTILSASIALYSIEERHGNRSGVAGSPLAAGVARRVMGGDAWVILPGCPSPSGGGDGDSDVAAVSHRCHPSSSPIENAPRAPSLGEDKELAEAMDMLESAISHADSLSDSGYPKEQLMDIAVMVCVIDALEKAYCILTANIPRFDFEKRNTPAQKKLMAPLVSISTLSKRRTHGSRRHPCSRPSV